MQHIGYPLPEETVISNFMYKVYGWMSCALAITAGVSYYVFKTETLFRYLVAHPALLFGLIVGQLFLVFLLALSITKMNLVVAIGAFIVYAVTMGITMSSIFFVYTESSIYATFLVASGMFAAMALYGYFTKADLTAIGSFAIMGLFGLIIGSLVNIFFQSPAFSYVLSGAGVLIFTLLTAYDVQKLKQIAQRLVADKQTLSKIAVFGALTLYLDFINLFMSLLQFMGQRREN